MLFNSYIFLMVFFPLVVAGYYALAKVHWRYAMVWLTGSSILFYAWWNPERGEGWSPFYLLLLQGSAAGNFLFAKAIADSVRKPNQMLFLTAGVSLNLALLASLNTRACSSHCSCL